LNYLGYTKEWLLGETIKQGAEDFKDVFLAQIDSKGHVYVDLYNDKAKVTQVKQKPLLATQLRKMQADLEGLRSKRTTQMQNRCITTNQGNFRILSIKSIHYLDNLYKKSLHGIVGETLVASAQHQCASSNGSAGGVCPILNSSLTTTKT